MFRADKTFLEELRQSLEFMQGKIKELDEDIKSPSTRGGRKEEKTQKKNNVDRLVKNIEGTIKTLQDGKIGHKGLKDVIAAIKNAGGLGGSTQREIDRLAMVIAARERLLGDIAISSLIEAIDQRKRGLNEDQDGKKIQALDNLREKLMDINEHGKQYVNSASLIRDIADNLIKGGTEIAATSKMGKGKTGALGQEFIALGQKAIGTIEVPAETLSRKREKTVDFSIEEERSDILMTTNVFHKDYVPPPPPLEQEEKLSRASSRRSSTDSIPPPPPLEQEEKLSRTSSTDTVRSIDSSPRPGKK